MNIFDTIGIHEIMNASDADDVMRKRLNGKSVFIGSTAFAAHDLRHTPVDSKLPGIYFHMNMVRMLLDGRGFASTEQSIYWSIGILLIGSILLIFISFLKNPILDLLFLVTFLFSSFSLDTFWLLPRGLEISLFFALLSIIASYSWLTFWHFHFANKDKAFLKQAFGSYISPELIEMMHKSGQKPSLGGEQKFLTAFFTDIQGFSSFSEKLTPTQLVELLNEYLTAMTDILLEENGTLDKYEGDAIIAFFGAPVELKDHPQKAVKVAIRMQSKLKDLREKWAKEGNKWPSIVHNMRMRIGINSGEMVTGNMGSKSRMNYTMMGDSVNLAARLEAAAKQYGVFIHISEATMQEIDTSEILIRELDTVRVVGKNLPVKTFEVIDLIKNSSQELQDFIKRFHEALDLYKKKEFARAKEIFDQLAQLEIPLRFEELPSNTISPSDIYSKRCEEFLHNPPPSNWDGIYSLTSK